MTSGLIDATTRRKNDGRRPKACITCKSTSCRNSGCNLPENALRTPGRKHPAGPNGAAKCCCTLLIKSGRPVLTARGPAGRPLLEDASRPFERAVNRNALATPTATHNTPLSYHRAPGGDRRLTRFARELGLEKEPLHTTRARARRPRSMQLDMRPLCHNLSEERRRRQHRVGRIGGVASWNPRVPRQEGF